MLAVMVTVTVTGRVTVASGAWPESSPEEHWSMVG
jgi:hypothetical protein